jgi:SAM-dependent methyltransferase
MTTSGHQSYEDNPFEDKTVAKEWANSVENEHGLIRDKETYPLVKAWIESVHPRIIVEIGSGQGILANTVQSAGARYIGVEPSVYLVERARALYPHENREFIIGNAYEIPLPDRVADTVFSVNVWFHLEDLETASREMARILEPGGSFLVSTANPNAYATWEGLYFDYTKDSKKIDGKVNIPINPLSRNTMYLHTLEQIKDALVASGFKIENTQVFGFDEKFGNTALFINIVGKKSV